MRAQIGLYRGCRLSTPGSVQLLSERLEDGTKAVLMIAMHTMAGHRQEPSGVRTGSMDSAVSGCPDGWGGANIYAGILRGKIQVRRCALVPKQAKPFATSLPPSNWCPMLDCCKVVLGASFPAKWVPLWFPCVTLVQRC
jgi:hypothetical protein